MVRTANGMRSVIKRMTILLSVAIILLGIAGIAAYFLIFRHANPPLPTNTVTIGEAKFNVEIASTSVEQARGLSYRADLGANDGMLFVFGNPGIQHFWMKDMNFSLDMIWISSDTVAGFEQNAEPEPGVSLLNLPIYTSPDNTDKVLEVNAGMVAKYNIKVGDTVTIGGNY